LAYPLLRYRLGSAIVVACLWGGCYTDPINMSPIVRIDAPPDPIFRGESPTYKATASDPDSDSVTLQWVLQTTPMGCPRGFDAPATWPTSGWSPGNELTLGSMETKARYCVWVKASDQYGAAAVDALTGDPQDHAPVAVLDLVAPPDAPSFPGRPMFILSAEKSTDADGDMMNFEWTLKASPSQTASLVPCLGQTMNKAVRCLTADAAGDYQVQVSVSDASMKDSIDKTLRVLPGQLPTAELDLVSPPGGGPYPLGSELRVSAAHSTGGDPTLVYDWAVLEPAPGSTAVLGDCGKNPSPDARCFVGEKPGSYRVTLKVHNETGDSAPVSATYVVAPDQPPCLDSTTPDITTPMTTMTTFTVGTVSDDLDPFPAVTGMSTTGMQWFVTQANGSSFAPAQKDPFPTFSLNPLAFSFGDVVRVRLEISDRDTERSAKAFLACGDADTCTLPSLIHPDTCFQRVTWTVRFLQ
jgi:hypothetical protein